MLFRSVDLSFLNDRFSVSYTYSRQNVKDQIFDIPLAASTGSSVYRTNGGKLHTDAHELSIGVTPIRNRNFQWDVNFNFSKTVSMVDELATGVNSIMLGGFVDPQVRAGIGYAYPVIYGSSFLRNENGDIVVDADGLPQYGGEDMVLGQITPKFMLGINTSFQIYKLSVSATLDWKNGGKMYHGSFNTMGFYGTTQESADRRQSNGFLFDLPAVKQNADGTYSKNDILISPELAYDYYDIMSGVSEGGVQDAGYLKFREITLSYPVWSGKGVEVNLSAFARNILVWSQLKGGFDPEASQGNTNMGGGFERFSLPTTSSYGFGLNVKF